MCVCILLFNSLCTMYLLIVLKLDYYAYYNSCCVKVAMHAMLVSCSCMAGSMFCDIMMQHARNQRGAMSRLTWQQISFSQQVSI